LLIKIFQSFTTDAAQSFACICTPRST